MVTDARSHVVSIMSKHPTRRHFVYDLRKLPFVRTLQVLRVLDQLIHDGWVTCFCETDQDTAGKRPPRSYYMLTEHGRTEIEQPNDRS